MPVNSHHSCRGEKKEHIKELMLARTASHIVPLSSCSPTPPCFFSKSISGTQHHPLFVSQMRESCLFIVAGYWRSSWWVAPSGAARSLWHTAHFPSPSGLWRRKLPATDRLSSVCVHILIIQSVLKMHLQMPLWSSVCLMEGDRWDEKRKVEHPHQKVWAAARRQTSC